MNSLSIANQIIPGQYPSNDNKESVKREFENSFLPPFKRSKQIPPAVEIISLDSDDEEIEETPSFHLELPPEKPQELDSDSDDLEILSERKLETPLLPTPSLSTPSLPLQNQVTQTSISQDQRAELVSRNLMYNKEIINLNNILREMTSKSLVSQQRYTLQKTKIDNINQSLRNASEAEKPRLYELCQSYVNSANNLQHQVNRFQTVANNAQFQIQRYKNLVLQNDATLRNLTNRTNAVTNVYEAEILRDRQAEPDLDLQNLLNNIRSEELPEEGIDSTPAELSVNLMKHQRIGLSWLKRMEQSSKGGILADDMGLGKTIQALALIFASKPPESYQYKTTLIIAPVSLLRQWASEIKNKTKQASSINVGIFHGDDKKQMFNFNQLRKFDVVLTSFSTLSIEWKKHYDEELKANPDRKFMPQYHKGGKSYSSPFFEKNAQFFRIIIDEAQNIKNKNAIASKAVHYLSGQYRFCLSGTPMQNNLEELYPLLRFMRIKPYCVEEKFRADIIIPIKSTSDQYDSYDTQHSLSKLRALLSAILLRRTKDSLIDGQPILQLPEKHISQDFVELEDDELSYYQSIEERIQKVARKLFNEGMKSAPILALLLRLRQACCHSYLVELGQLKQEEAETDDGRLFKDWRKMIKVTNELDEDIKEKILTNVTSSDEVMQQGYFSTCQRCFEVVENPVILSECGHMICRACFKDYFNEEEDDEVRCMECERLVAKARVIDFKLFKAQYIDNIDQLERFAKQTYSKWLTPRTNAKIIREFITRDETLNPSAKISKCLELIQDIRSKGDDKIIVFSQFVTLFEIMKLVFKHEGIKYLQYDGSMTMENKNATIKQFYQNSEVSVLLLSLRAGNVGLTLTCANHVIIMDPFWNPFVEEQAMDRAHRIGQAKEVFVHKILIENTVESRIQQLQEHKKKLISNALNENEMRNVSRLGRSELGFLFGLNGLR